MFDLGPRAATDGVSSSHPECKRLEEWECHDISSWFADDVQYCDEQCMSIYTCEPYEDPEHQGGNDFVDAGGDQDPEEPV